MRFHFITLLKGSISSLLVVAISFYSFLPVKGCPPFKLIHFMQHYIHVLNYCTDVCCIFLSNEMVHVYDSKNDSVLWDQFSTFTCLAHTNICLFNLFSIFHSLHHKQITAVHVLCCGKDHAISPSTATFGVYFSTPRKMQQALCWTELIQEKSLVPHIPAP